MCRLTSHYFGHKLITGSPALQPQCDWLTVHHLMTGHEVAAGSSHRWFPFDQGAARGSISVSKSRSVTHLTHTPHHYSNRQWAVVFARSSVLMRLGGSNKRHRLVVAHVSRENGENGPIAIEADRRVKRFLSGPGVESSGRNPRYRRYLYEFLCAGSGRCRAYRYLPCRWRLAISIILLVRSVYL